MASVFDEVQDQTQGSVFEEVGSMSAGDVLSQAAENLLPSAKENVGNLVSALAHPIDTAKTMLDLGAGIIQNVLPEGFVQYMGEDKASRELASKVGKFYVNRYGSVENAKKAIAQDPVGVMADAATVLGIGGGLARGIATPIPGAAAAQVARVGGALSKAGAVIDPINAMMKIPEVVGSAGVKAAASKLSGVGERAIEEAYASGKQGGAAGQAFRENMRGNVPVENVLNDARDALGQMKAQKNREYANNMSAVKMDKTQLSFDDIDKTLGSAESGVRFGSQIKNERAAKAIAETRDLVEQWKSLDPAQYHTPEGLDALKQKVGSILEELPFEQRTARMAIGNVYSSIKGTITKQAPIYSKVMKEYEAASESVRDIERALSIGDRKAADAAIRKLQSATRSNVNTNFGNRAKLVGQLEQASGKPLMAALSGQAMSQLSPVGMAGNLSPLNLMQLGGDGAALAKQGIAAGMMSPRTVGEVTHGMGRVAGQFDQPYGFGLLQNLMYQTASQMPELNK